MAPAIELADEVAAAKAQLETVKIDGHSYFTDDTARLQGGVVITAGMSDDWIDSPEYKVLLRSTFDRLEVLHIPGLKNPFIVFAPLPAV